MQSHLDVRESIRQGTNTEEIGLKNGSFCSLTSRAESRIALSYWGAHIAHDCSCLKTIAVTQPHTKKLPKAGRKWILLLLVVHAFSSTSFPIPQSQISGNTCTFSFKKETELSLPVSWGSLSSGVKYEGLCVINLSLSFFPSPLIWKKRVTTLTGQTAC